MPSASASQRNTRVKRLPAPPVDEITLRLVGTEHHGRLVRITSAKCTVGTSPGCTLRLKANGVAPIHCLILRGPNGTVVRRLADDAFLNGRPFDDAPLAAEDRLQLGSVTFVVVQVPLSRQAPSPEPEEAVPQPPTEDTLELVRETRRHARRRARNLLNALRAGKRSSDQLNRLVESRKLELEQTARQTALLHRELAAQRERQRTVEEEQRAAVLQVGQLTASLERLRHELLAVQSQRQSEADRWRLDRSRMTEDLALRDARLHDAEGQLQQKQWELEQLHLQFQRQQRQLELEHEQAVAARQRREKDAETSQLEIGRLSEELLAQDRARLTAEGELATVRRELEQLRETLTRARQEAAEDRAALKAERDSKVDQSESLQAKLKEENAQVAKIQAELQARTEELDRLRQAGDRNVKVWQVERLQMIKEVGQAAAHDAKLLTEHRKQLDEAAAKTRELEQQLADSRAEFAARTAEAEARKSESISQLEKLLAEREAELARLQSEKRDQTIQWNASREQLSAAESVANERLDSLAADLAAAREEAALHAADLETQLTAERESRAQAERDLERLREELADLRGRQMQTMVFEQPVAQPSAPNAEQVAALEQQRVELAEREERLERQQEQLNAERESTTAEIERARAELHQREEHFAAESARLSAGMHQLQEFEARLVRQQDEFARKQRELEAQEAPLPTTTAYTVPTESPANDDEAGFLMPADATPAEPQEPAALESAEPNNESPEPAAEEPPARMVTEPFFISNATAESTVLEPEVAAPEQFAEEPAAEPSAESSIVEPTAPPAEEPAGRSSAFERRLAALAAQAAKARGEEVPAPQPEPEPVQSPAPVVEPAPVAEQPPVVETPVTPPISPDLLPQWRFEHETPQRMDTITGLRMRNLLDEIRNLPPEEVLGDESPKTASLVDMMPQSQKLQFEPAPAPPQPETPPTPESSEPVEEIDIFSRLKEAGILKGDAPTPITLPPREEPAIREPVYEPVRSFLPTEPEEEAQPEAEAVSQTVMLSRDVPNPFASSKPAEPAGDEEEDSIEDYMQQLLQRVRGDGPPTGSGTSLVYRAAAAPQSAPVESSAKKATPPAPDLPPVKPEEYVPRSAAAERNVNLAAMRELANSSARSAIQKHQKQVGLLLSGGKLITAVVAIATAAVLVSMGYTYNVRLTIGAGGLGFVIGLYWLMQALFLSQGWWKSVQRAMGRK